MARSDGTETIRVVNWRAVKLWGIIAAVIVAIIGSVNWVAAQQSAQDDPARVIQYCKERVMAGAPANGGTWNGEVVGEWTAYKMDKSNDKRYAKGWMVGGVMPQSVMSWADEDVRFSCSVYVDSSGDVITGTMAIHGL